MSSAKSTSSAAAPPLIPVASNDALWLQDSGTNLMLIQAVYIIDRITPEDLRVLWQKRIMDLEGGRRYPRFELKVVRRRGRFFWQRDPDFSLDRHVIAAPETGIHTREELQDYVGRLANQPLPEDRPRWQLQVIEDFGEGTSVIVGRVHHCMGDGVALVPVIFSLFDEVQVDGKVVRSDHTKTAKALTRWTTMVKAPLAGPLILIRKMLWRADRSDAHGPKLSGTKRVAWTEPIDFEVLRRIKHHFRATVNDVLMTCVAGAFHRYLESTPGGSVTSIRLSMPVNVRSPNEQPRMENKFAAVLLELPVGIRDIRRRVSEVKQRMDALKRSVEPIATYGIAYVMLKALPLKLSGKIIDFLANKCTAVVTNVPGPPHDLYIGGRKLHNLVFWVPQRAEIGIGISILSFSGTVRVGIYTDVELIPDPSRLARAFEEEFAALHDHTDG